MLNGINSVQKDDDRKIWRREWRYQKLDKENNLRVYVTLYVHPNIVIKDLTASIQNRVKEAIKKTSDLETKAVNVRVRNITPTIENKVEG